MSTEYDASIIQHTFRALTEAAPEIMDRLENCICKQDKLTLPDALPLIRVFDRIIRSTPEDVLRSFRLKDIRVLGDEKIYAYALIILDSEGEFYGFGKGQLHRFNRELERRMDRKPGAPGYNAYMWCYKRFLEICTHLALCDERCREAIQNSDCGISPVSRVVRKARSSGPAAAVRILKRPNAKAHPKMSGQVIDMAAARARLHRG